MPKYTYIKIIYKSYNNHIMNDLYNYHISDFQFWLYNNHIYNQACIYYMIYIYKHYILSI